MTQYIIIAFLSILIVCFAVYTIWLLKRLVVVSESIMDLNEEVALFSSHLEATYKKPLYYGDETLKFLMSHTRDLRDLLEDYEDVVYITEPIEEIEVVDDQQEEQIDGPTQVQEENVFYAGTRRRDS